MSFKEPCNWHALQNRFVIQKTSGPLSRNLNKLVHCKFILRPWLEAYRFLSRCTKVLVLFSRYTDILLLLFSVPCFTRFTYCMCTKQFNHYISKILRVFSFFFFKPPQHEERRDQSKFWMKSSHSPTDRLWTATYTWKYYQIVDNNQNRSSEFKNIGLARC